MSEIPTGPSAEDRSATPADVDDYSPSKFYTRASDKQGHSWQTRVNLPQDWQAIIARIVELVPEYEYSTEFIRDAVFHRAHWLHEHLDDPELQLGVAEMKLRAELDRTVQQRASRTKYLDDSRAHLLNLRIDGNLAGIDERIAALRQFAAVTPEPFATQALHLAAQYSSFG